MAIERWSFLCTAYYKVFTGWYVNLEDTKYRRIPPSQITRDEKRLKSFIDKKEQDTCQTKEHLQNDCDGFSCWNTADSPNTFHNAGSLSVTNKPTADNIAMGECSNKTNIVPLADGGFSCPVEALADQGDQHLSTPDAVTAVSKQERGSIKRHNW